MPDQTEFRRTLDYTSRKLPRDAAFAAPGRNVPNTDVYQLSATLSDSALARKEKNERERHEAVRLESSASMRHITCEGTAT